MARRLRLQFEGAAYHVINRGNYRRDIFESVGAAQAFETTLSEACEHFGWQLHAYVIMRNHYHLAVGTPQPNLVDGMHWLQSTFATRFNRFRSERGHLFQGRYHAMLVENAHALGRVASYIHLNPVRAKIIPTEQVGAFRWCSLRRFMSTERPKWLAPIPWLSALGFDDTLTGWRAYVTMLMTLSGDVTAQKEMGFAEMSRGWAIGTHGWRKALAKEHTHIALAQGLSPEEHREFREARWQAALKMVLADAGKTEVDLMQGAKGAEWKIQLARRLRREANAPCRWIADMLKMGKASSVRVYLGRGAKISN